MGGPASRNGGLSGPGIASLLAHLAQDDAEYVPATNDRQDGCVHAGRIVERAAFHERAEEMR